jgi:hypothetical protein
LTSGVQGSDTYLTLLPNPKPLGLGSLVHSFGFRYSSDAALLHSNHRSKAAAQTATRVKRKRENSVASDEGSAGSLTPTPSKNFKAVIREQYLPSTAEVSFSESLDLSLSDGDDDAVRDTSCGGAASSSSFCPLRSYHRPPSLSSRDGSHGQMRTAAAAFSAAGLLRTPGKGKGWGDGTTAGQDGKGKERERGNREGNRQRCAHPQCVVCVSTVDVGRPLQPLWHARYLPLISAGPLFIHLTTSS